MAKSISIQSGSILAGSPIEVAVESETAGSKATFHRVKLIVSAALSTGSDFEVFELSSPAGDSETVSFDISDTLRTVAGRFVYVPVETALSYPYILYKLSAYDEYMLDGILYENVGEREYVNTVHALMGAFTDAERYFSSGSKSLTAYTRKPSSGEICSPEETLVYAPPPVQPLTIHSVLSSGPSVQVMPLEGKSGTVQAGGRTVYVDVNAEDRMQFQFVNGLGVVESVSAEMLETLSTSGSYEKDIVGAPSSFGSVNRIFLRKSGRRPVYKCSTGYVTREWAEWWHNEFLGSDGFRRSLPASCWVRLEGKWLPCVTYPEDDVTIYDRTKGDMTSIAFSVELAIDGLPSPTL